MDPAADRLHPIRADVADWSETLYVHVWNPDDEVGVFVHAGRLPGDLELWWMQTVAMLPGELLVVDRSFGRAPDDAGPATGVGSVRCVEPGRRFAARFDGAGELTTTAGSTRGPVGAGPAVPLSFSVDLEAVAPVWDLHQAAGITDLGWAAVHHTQGLRSTGWLSGPGGRWSLDGVAHRDHSSGPRRIDGLGGLGFAFVVFPGSERVLHGLETLDRSGEPGHRVGGHQRGEECDVSADVELPGLDAPASLAPTVAPLRLAGHRVEAEVRHGYSLSMLDPNDSVAGIAWDAEDPLVVTQSTVRVVDADGDVGYGVFERDRRRSLLPAGTDA